MIYPTIYVGGESRFKLPAALSDFTDELTGEWVQDAVEAAAIALEDMDFVAIPDEKLQTFWYVDATTREFAVAFGFFADPSHLRIEKGWRA